MSQQKIVSIQVLSTNGENLGDFLMDLAGNNADEFFAESAKEIARYDSFENANYNSKTKAFIAKLSPLGELIKNNVGKFPFQPKYRFSVYTQQHLDKLRFWKNCIAVLKEEDFIKMYKKDTFCDELWVQMIKCAVENNTKTILDVLLGDIASHKNVNLFVC